MGERGTTRYKFCVGFILVVVAVVDVERGGLHINTFYFFIQMRKLDLMLVG